MINTTDHSERASQWGFRFWPQPKITQITIEGHQLAPSHICKSYIVMLRYSTEPCFYSLPLPKPTKITCSNSAHTLDRDPKKKNKYNYTYKCYMLVCRHIFDYFGCFRLGETCDPKMKKNIEHLLKSRSLFCLARVFWLPIGSWRNLFKSLFRFCNLFIFF